MPSTPDLAAFGYGSLKQNGRAALGNRRLLIVLGEYDNHPPISETHPREYYERLGFGNPTPPFSTRDPVNPANLCQYFRENSNGRFTFNCVGVVGPISLGTLAFPPANADVRAAEALKKVAGQSPESFLNADTNTDGTISEDELCVLLIENIPGAEPDTTYNAPFDVSLDLPGGLVVNKTVRVRVAGGGPLTPFYQLAHEVSHLLRTVDMYNTGQGNFMLTLMSRYPFPADDQVTVHLDIWHKMLLGWAEPRIFPLHTGGTTTVHDGPDGAVILWDNQHLANEYFIVERRKPLAALLAVQSELQKLYDVDFPADGVLVWRVGQGLANHLGAPDLTFGGQGVWAAGQQTPSLMWSDDTLTNVSIGFAAESDGSMRIDWGEVVQMVPIGIGSHGLDHLGQH